MSWKTPKVTEVALGGEINCYACARRSKTPGSAAPQGAARSLFLPVRPCSQRSSARPPVADFRNGIRNAPGCRRARSGDASALPRTQASVAVSGDDGESWVLLNASPDLRQQIEANAFLHPRTGLRSTADRRRGADRRRRGCHRRACWCCASGSRFTVLAAPRVLAVLDANPIFEVLARDIVMREPVSPRRRGGAASARWCALRADDGTVRGARQSAAVSGAPGRRAPDRRGRQYRRRLRDRRAREKTVLHSGLCRDDPTLAERLRGADLVLFDGTLWRDDEMIRAGLGPKTGLRMGHMSADRSRRHPGRVCRA